MNFEIELYRASRGKASEVGLPEQLLMEMCTILWVAAIVCGAWFADFPYNVPLWIWVIGMVGCVPATAMIAVRRDETTTFCRELAYFFRQGIILMRIVFWPISLAVTYFGGSERKMFISRIAEKLRSKNEYIQGDTAYEIANDRAAKFDRHCDAVESAASYVSEGAGELSVAACRRTVLAATLTGVAGSVAYAQDAKPAPTVSIFLARTGENLQHPHTGTYRLAEFLQVRGKWIYPDVGCVDFASGTYRECFVGGGRTLFNNKMATLVGEAYFVQATGPAANSARYLWLNPILDLRLTPKITGQASYFPYIPLNRSARIQQVIERAKLEYAFTNHVKAGGGYGAYQFGNGPWQSKPFITTTVSTKAGSFEFWLQKMPQGAQVQMRYAFAHAARH